MDQTLFYVFGIGIVLSALALAAVGLRNESFPPNRIVLAGVIAYFVAMVGATTTFAFLNARDEQRKRNAEKAEAAASQPASGTTTTTGAAPQGKATTLKLAAQDNTIAYDTMQLSGKAGQVTIDFDNPSTALSHDVCLEGPTGQQIGCSDTITNSTTSLSENLKPGKYTFFCSVDGHRQAGMEGTLTVN
jgi:plastocyanin